MRRPKQAVSDPRPEVFAKLREGVVIPTDDDAFKLRLRTAYHEGLGIDNGSNAAGNAFLALSWYNRRNTAEAVRCATRAARANRRAWEPLLEVLLGTRPEFEP